MPYHSPITSVTWGRQGVKKYADEITHIGFILMYISENEMVVMYIPLTYVKWSRSVVSDSAYLCGIYFSDLCKEHNTCINSMELIVYYWKNVLFSNRMSLLWFFHLQTNFNSFDYIKNKVLGANEYTELWLFYIIDNVRILIYFCSYGTGKRYLSGR